MHIRQNVRLPVPIAVSAPRLPDAVAKTVGDAPRVGFTVGRASIRKRVRVRFGETEPIGQWIRIPVSWSAEPAEGLFPTLEGYLQLEPISPEESKLSLRANYEPPLGRLGQAIDDAALHNVARATITDFLDALRAQVLKED
ncbi:MAG TPA: hypothetical protein VF160_07045 [Candidatus Dormibacteraeota bacterium]